MLELSTSNSYSSSFARTPEVPHLTSTRDRGLIEQNLDNRTYDGNHVYVPGHQGKQLLKRAQEAGLKGHTYTTVASIFTTVASPFFLTSSFLSVLLL